MNPAQNLDKNVIDEVMNDPSVKNASPEDYIHNLSHALGARGLFAMDGEEYDRVVNVYFQAFSLHHDKWTPISPGIYAQSVTFALAEIPEKTRLIADVLIETGEIELEYYDKYVRSIGVSNGSIIFQASQPIPIDITIGLKCVDVFERPIPLSFLTLKSDTGNNS